MNCHSLEDSLLLSNVKEYTTVVGKSELINCVRIGVKTEVKGFPFLAFFQEFFQGLGQNLLLCKFLLLC